MTDTHDPGSHRDIGDTTLSALTVDAASKQVAELLSTQYAGLLGLIRRKLKDRELAADLVGEAIAITLEHVKAGRVKQQEQVAGYVFQVSMNLLRNYQRNLDNRHDLRSNSDRIDWLPSEDTADSEAEQTRARTRQLIESLSSARDREVIKRFYLDEEDRQSICAAMDLTPLQFTQVMSRARQRMKNVFDASGLKRSDLLSLLLPVALMGL